MIIDCPADKLELLDVEFELELLPDFEELVEELDFPVSVTSSALEELEELEEDLDDDRDDEESLFTTAVELEELLFREPEKL